MIAPQSRVTAIRKVENLLPFKILQGLSNPPDEKNILHVKTLPNEKQFRNYKIYRKFGNRLPFLGIKSSVEKH